MVGYFLAKNRFAISTFVEILIHDTNLYIFSIITKKMAQLLPYERAITKNK